MADADQKKEFDVNHPGFFAIFKRIAKENGRDYIKDYAITITCMFLAAGSTSFLAWVMEDVVNEAFVKKNTVAVWLGAGGILLAFIIKGISTYVQTVLLSKIGNNIVARYQKRLFDHLMALNISYFSDRRSAQMAARISQNVSGIRDTLNVTVTLLARDVVTLIGLVSVMVIKDPVLSLVVFFVAPPIIFSLRYITKKLRNLNREAIGLSSYVLGTIQESVQAITIVKAFTMEQQLSKRLGASIKNIEQRSNHIARLGESVTPVTDTLSGIAISGVVVFSGYRAIYNDIPPGALFAFITALLLAYQPARRLTKMHISLDRAATNAHMIYEILDTTPLQEDKDSAFELVVDKGKIEFQNISFSYPKSQLVLNEVSFIADVGKTTAIVGPSGAGKSTIISLLPRFYDPSSGRILIDGVDIRNATKLSLRQNLSYVSQQPWLFEGTIRDNIRYGRYGATDAEIEDAAKMAYAHEFIIEQPEGYDTELGENGITLSGGQRQRLSIARALVRNAPILILDEATSALDNQSEAEVQKAFDSAMKGRTVLVIAHRLSTIANADKIVVMDLGQVVQEGSHQELIQKDGLYKHLHDIYKSRDERILSKEKDNA